MIRLVALTALAPFLAACEPEPTPDAEPPLPQPQVMERENERLGHLAGAARVGDFKVNFSEPFIQFENRGEEMSISQPYGGPRYRVVDVMRGGDETTWIFRGLEGAVPGEEPFILTIEKLPCTNTVTGEQTDYVATLGTSLEPRKAQSCAAPAR